MSRRVTALFGDRAARSKLSGTKISPSSNEGKGTLNWGRDWGGGEELEEKRSRMGEESGRRATGDLVAAVARRRMGGCRG
ncbi:Os03g0596500 [Oryza sativa Japonica Group]|jgi:hypothetical protein|nr:Os03g0596500 [Oryza sativa Japonica Group]